MKEGSEGRQVKEGKGTRIVIIMNNNVKESNHVKEAMSVEKQTWDDTIQGRK